jgi:hypothetical protein
MELVTVSTSPFEINVPVVVPSVITLEDGVADATSWDVPDVMPLNINPLMPTIELLIVDVLCTKLLEVPLFIIEVFIVALLIIGDVKVFWVRV